MESFKIPLTREIVNRSCCGSLGNYSLGLHFIVKNFTAPHYRGFSRKYSAALFKDCATCNKRTNMNTK
jgi:hypothetical protein